MQNHKFSGRLFVDEEHQIPGASYHRCIFWFTDPEKCFHATSEGTTISHCMFVSVSPGRCIYQADVN